MYKLEFINELGNAIKVTAKLRKDDYVVWSLSSINSSQSGVITKREAVEIVKALSQVIDSTTTI